jgi:signal transduction histidine kinase
LRLFLPDADVLVNVRGNVVGDDDADGVHWPITKAGTAIGMIVFNGRDDAIALMPTLVDVGALAIEIIRLRIELRRQLEQVEASRARIAAAANEQRRQIERDLHDGAQQRLVSIGLALRHAQHALGSEEPAEATRTLDGAVAEIAVAIDELRELARGIRPAHLDAGLGPALRELARRAPVQVDVAADDVRFAPDIESAAYFTASEGVTNAIKHGRANAITVRAERVDGNLVVSVADNGVGGADPGNGSGLTGLSDRVTTQGGTLTVYSPRGKGTTLTAEFPCAS